MKTVVVLQPSFMPWLGAIHQIWRSDVFVFYDDVDFDKHGWRNRNRIKGPGGVQWLTVPVLHHGKFGQRICDARINNASDWRQRHLRALWMNYRRAAHFDEVYPALEDFYTQDWDRVEDVAEASTRLLCGLLGLERQIVCSKLLDIDGSRSERLVKICQHFGADHYYSGRAATSYLEIALFDSAGIEVEFQDYHHPTYRQLWGDFVPYLSVLDLLFNEGNRALEVVLNGK